MGTRRGTRTVLRGAEPRPAVARLAGHRRCGTGDVECMAARARDRAQLKGWRGRDVHVGSMVYIP